MTRAPGLSLMLCLALAACASPEPGVCGAADLERLSTRPSYAVVSSDYTSTAIGLLDSDGSVITAAWVDSGTTRPGIVAALSGDVSLPSSPFGPCAVVLMDRFGTDVVTILDACADEPVRSQVDVGSSFAANPHDVLLVSGVPWVTRYTANHAVDSGDVARGNDIAVLEGGRVARRIDLGAIGDDGEALARPDRMARLRGAGVERVVVGLARLSADFSHAAPGALALVDPATMQAHLHLVDGLRNCGEVDAVGDAVVVTCQGAPFGDEAERRVDAGLVAYRLGPGPALVEVAGWRAADHPDAPVPSGPTVPIHATRWLTVAWGELGAGVPDRGLLIDGDAELLFEAPAFSVGDGLYDEAHDLILLPEADRGVVLRYRGDGSPRDPIETTGCHGLPPREVRRVAFP